MIGGFSMGTVMSYAIALGEGRPSPAAILAFSGFIPTVEGWRPALEGREGLPVLIHHGRQDPIIAGRVRAPGRDAALGGGLDVDYVETDAGHSLPPELAEGCRPRQELGQRRGHLLGFASGGAAVGVGTRPAALTFRKWRHARDCD